ncbi:MAG: hypothetical protein QOF70_6846 [Acetobacteraceae bacterium]|nr:hypothetical protein [Acetobacteraceae bacterium]
MWFAAWWQAYAVVIWPRVDSQFDGAVDVLHSASFEICHHLDMASPAYGPSRRTDCLARGSGSSNS